MGNSAPNIGDELGLRCRFGEMPEHQRVYTIVDQFEMREDLVYNLFAPTTKVFRPYGLIEYYGFRTPNLMEGIEAEPYDQLFLLESELSDPRWSTSIEQDAIGRPFKGEDLLEALTYRATCFFEVHNQNPDAIRPIRELIRTLQSRGNDFSRFELKSGVRTRILTHIEGIERVGHRDRVVSEVTELFNKAVLDILEKLSPKLRSRTGLLN